jgi:hypothetical protein
MGGRFDAKDETENEYTGKLLVSFFIELLIMPSILSRDETLTREQANARIAELINHSDECIKEAVRLAKEHNLSFHQYPRGDFYPTKESFVEDNGHYHEDDFTSTQFPRWVSSSDLC